MFIGTSAYTIIPILKGTLIIHFNTQPKTILFLNILTTILTFLGISKDTIY